jgi:hydrogenase maturation protease
MVLPAVADLAAMSARTAIIGCGNPNRRDDGAGMEVVRLLRAAPDESAGRICLLDAGTDGMGVMFAARGCGSLIIVDACQSGAEAGAIFEVPGAELAQRPPDSFSLHDFRWDHALYAGRRIFAADFPADVAVFLIEAQQVDFGIGLSPAVAGAAKRVAAIIGERVRIRCAKEPLS